jgi:hypothetical protein
MMKIQTYNVRLFAVNATEPSLDFLGLFSKLFSLVCPILPNYFPVLLGMSSVIKLRQFYIAFPATCLQAIFLRLVLVEVFFGLFQLAFSTFFHALLYQVFGPKSARRELRVRYSAIEFTDGLKQTNEPKSERMELNHDLAQPNEMYSQLAFSLRRQRLPRLTLRALPLRYVPRAA